MKPINLSEKRKLVKINEILKEIEDDDLYTKFIKKLDVTFVTKIKELMSVILVTKNKNAIVSINIPVNVDELEEDTPTYRAKHTITDIHEINRKYLQAKFAKYIMYTILPRKKRLETDVEDMLKGTSYEYRNNFNMPKTIHDLMKVNGYATMSTRDVTNYIYSITEVKKDILSDLISNFAPNKLFTLEASLLKGNYKLKDIKNFIYSSYSHRPRMLDVKHTCYVLSKLHLEDQLNGTLDVRMKDGSLFVHLVNDFSLGEDYWVYKGVTDTVNIISDVFEIGRLLDHYIEEDKEKSTDKETVYSRAGYESFMEKVYADNKDYMFDETQTINKNEFRYTDGSYELAKLLPNGNFDIDVPDNLTELFKTDTTVYGVEYDLDK